VFVVEPEFLDESLLLLFELLLFLRAQGGRSVCCGGGVGVG
jgi:hypothetical protein